MKHWSPDTFAPPGPLPRTLARARAHERRAAMAGLALVAAMCLVIAIGAHALLAPPKPVDRSVVE